MHVQLATSASPPCQGASDPLRTAIGGGIVQGRDSRVGGAEGTSLTDYHSSHHNLFRIPCRDGVPLVFAMSRLCFDAVLSHR
jgi:hypothetical protein